MPSTLPRKYRVTVGITDTRNPGPPLIHVVKTVAYDALDAGAQASFELTKLGVLTMESLTDGIKIEIHNVQPDCPPLSDESLKGGDRGPLDERMATFLFINGY